MNAGVTQQLSVIPALFLPPAFFASRVLCGNRGRLRGGQTPLLQIRENSAFRQEYPVSNADYSISRPDYPISCSDCSISWTDCHISRTVCPISRSDYSISWPVWCISKSVCSISQTVWCISKPAHVISSAAYAVSRTDNPPANPASRQTGHAARTISCAATKKSAAPVVDLTDNDVVLRAMRCDQVKNGNMKIPMKVRISRRVLGA